MSADVAISVKGVHKGFLLPHERMTGLKQAVINFRSARTIERQRVLKGVSFEIERGEFFGIVGRNGSGKSTLLKILAGVYVPEQGAVEVNGTLTPFIELGVGFNPELTGRENVYLNGALLGFDRKQMRAMYDEIVDFAELHEFMDAKLKNYSSGMQVRLAFSVAMKVQSDILLIDEVLAVGDAAFQRKCYDHFMHLKKTKTTVILVTHDMGAVRQYCDRAIMVEAGEVVESGTPEKVAQAYQKLFLDEMVDEVGDGPADDGRWGTGRMRLEESRASVHKGAVDISATYTANTDLESVILGFTIYNPAGNNILEGNTLRMKKKISNVAKGQRVSITWRVPDIFPTGKYDVSIACCDQSTTEFYDWVNAATSFSINKEDLTSGLVDPPLTIEQFEVKK